VALQNAEITHPETIVADDDSTDGTELGHNSFRSRSKSTFSE
jgi:hypothetical protein